jgi:hypothetical protein
VLRETVGTFGLEQFMDNLKASFEDVADWCEKHLEEKRGREIGMTFGGVLRAYGRLATLSSRLHGEEQFAKELNAEAEELLMRLSMRFFIAYSRNENWNRLIDPAPMCTNMTYDTGPAPQE